MLRGFGFTPREVGEDIEDFQLILSETTESPFYILKTEKGEGGPNRYHLAHQIPLKEPRTNAEELKQLEEWLKSYQAGPLIEELFTGAETASTGGYNA
ncbi:hypothetical protein IJG22_03295, partial [Candidatus Saccharibacteria bacterium]|nr:hypothetical protein [Candidatus Saccharibacteria bacterium]